MSSNAGIDPNAPLKGTASRVDRQSLIIIIWVCFSLATLFVGLRLAVRWRQNRTLLPDDFWIAWAWVCLLTMAVIQTEQMDALWYITNLAAGRFPVDEQTVPRTEELSRWQFPIIKLFWTVLWSVKASFLAIFLRLVKPFPVLHRLWYCVCVFVFLAYIGCIVSSALTCDPPSDYFKAGKCSSHRELWRQRFNVLFSTTVDIVSDLAIMALPLGILPSLQLDRKKKIGLGVAFSLSIIIICVAILRMTQVISGTSVDLVGLAIWGAVETSTAVIVGSLPPLKALLTRSVRKYGSSKKSGQMYGGSHPMGTDGANKAYGSGSATRSTIVAESIPLDDYHHSRQHDGRIYVQKMFETRVENDGSSADGDEVAIVSKGQNKAWAS